MCSIRLQLSVMSSAKLGCVALVVCAVKPKRVKVLCGAPALWRSVKARVGVASSDDEVMELEVGCNVVGE